MAHTAAEIGMVKRPLERDRLIRTSAGIERNGWQESLEIEIESRWSEAAETSLKIESHVWLAASCYVTRINSLGAVTGESHPGLPISSPRQGTSVLHGVQR